MKWALYSTSAPGVEFAPQVIAAKLLIGSIRHQVSHPGRQTFWGVASDTTIPVIPPQTSMESVTGKHLSRHSSLAEITCTWSKL